MRYIFLLLNIIFISCDAQNKGFFIKPTPGLEINKLNNQVLIWDATNPSGIIVDGSNNVQQLTDLSGNGNNMIPASSGVRPPYSATGGSNNLPYITYTSGKTLGITSISYNSSTFNSSPYTMYAVVKCPSIPADGSVMFKFGTFPAIQRVATLGSDGWRMYMQVSPFYSLSVDPGPSRTDWMLIKIVVKDGDSFWYSVNDEPMVRPRDSALGAPFTLLDAVSFTSFINLRFAEVRIFSEALHDGNGYTNSKDNVIKNYFINKYGLTRPVGQKNVLIFGDSHSFGVMSGTGNVLGTYVYRMETAHTYNITNMAVSSTVVQNSPPGTFNMANLYPDFVKSKWSDYNLVLAYGTNDANLRGFGVGLTQSQWIAAYKSYIQDFINAGFSPSKIIICTPVYSTSTVINNTKLSEVVGDIRQIAIDMNLTLCDVYQAMINAGQDINTIPGTDGIHGNDAVHTTWLNTLTPLIQ